MLKNMSASSTGKKQKGKFQPKGRMVESKSLAEIDALISPKDRARDLLIENLHIIQDKYGYLSVAHLAALAAVMKLSYAEIWEVASFYDHFILVKESDSPPAPRIIRVCTSLSCMLKNSESIYQQLKQAQIKDVDIVKAPCIGACDKAPAIADGHHLITDSEFENIIAVATQPKVMTPLTDYRDFAAYRKDGGYKLVEDLASGQADKQSLLEEMNKSALRGLGGAGFPTGRKWQIVAGYPEPRLMAVNGDEGEPGTFKDRLYLSTDPHKILEGILIAAYIVGIEKAYIYIRDEYPEILDMLRGELEKVLAAGLAGHVHIDLRRGAGAYICGEESAMIESIEGKRGLPRHRPPYVAEHGLFGRPTLVNNVETLYWIRDILEHGADWYNQQGQKDHPGIRSYSVSGRVKRPGVVRAAAGTTVQYLIEACGGMADGHDFKAYLPGGASGGILPASKEDIPLDFGGRLAELGCFVGSHAVVILSHKDNMWDVAVNLMQFFAHESCGQCTPCRAGTEKAVDLMRQDRPDPDLLQDLADVMADASICGLGQAAPNPLLTVMRYFPEDIPVQAK